MKYFEIQEESGAKVHFTDKDTNRGTDDDRTVLIRGTTETAQKAELMIHQIMADMPVIITEEIEVPGFCLGRIIGRGGESIREMSRTSRCKIFIDRSQDDRRPQASRTITITGPQTQIQLAKDDRRPQASRTITITGPQTQIQFAKTLIEEKVEKEEAFRAKTAVNAANREQRKPAKRRAETSGERVALPSKVVEPESSWDAGDARPQIAPASPVKEFMEVFVSAVEHPGHFWLQVVTESSLGLDKLVDDMTAFYSNQDTAQEYSVSEVKTGDMVAAPFDLDKSWYRARVLGLVDGKVDLYYIDFGDNGLLSTEALRDLKPEYLSLPVQAIECSLASIVPVGEEWSEEACNTFESLSHCAEWKVLSARTVSYLPEASGQTMPCVQLVDNNAEPAMDLAAELVSKGLAMWEPSAPPAAASQTVRPDPVSPSD